MTDPRAPFAPDVEKLAALLDEYRHVTCDAHDHVNCRMCEAEWLESRGVSVGPASPVRPGYVLAMAVLQSDAWASADDELRAAVAHFTAGSPVRDPAPPEFVYCEKCGRSCDPVNDSDVAVTVCADCFRTEEQITEEGVRAHDDMIADGAEPGDALRAGIGIALGLARVRGVRDPSPPEPPPFKCERCEYAIRGRVITLHEDCWKYVESGGQ